MTSHYLKCRIWCWYGLESCVCVFVLCVCVFGGKESDKGFLWCALLFVVGRRMGWGLFSLLVLFSVGTNLQYKDHS